MKRKLSIEFTSIQVETVEVHFYRMQLSASNTKLNTVIASSC
jgi:hypothetical protein